MAAAPTAADIAIVVRALLAEILEVQVESIGLGADLADELEADSLQQLELMTAIEEHFHIRLDVDDWADARTVDELVERTMSRILTSAHGE